MKKPPVKNLDRKAGMKEFLANVERSLGSTMSKACLRVLEANPGLDEGEVLRLARLDLERGVSLDGVIAAARTRTNSRPCVKFRLNKSFYSSAG
jgi:hypothetical protein